MERLSVVQGDITRQEVDVIVNAANEWMLGGGGVDGAIHAAAGAELVEACRAVPEVRPGIRCPTGEARLTPAFKLPARWVVHTVGPVWRGGTSGEPDLLASCYRESLVLAVARAAKSIAFPAISTGVFRFPIGPASEIAVAQSASFLVAHPTFEEIRLVAFDARLAVVLRTAVSAVRAKSPGAF